MRDVSDPPVVPLSRRRKAAIVVQMLIADGGRLPLSDLPESLQELLASELADLRLLDRATMEAVAAEFAATLDKVGMAAPGGQDHAIAALADHLSPDLARRLQAAQDMARHGDHWPQLVALPVPQLVQIIRAEAVETCAVLLSKLPVAKAAELLTQTKGDRARRITYAMALTDKVAPDVVRRIGAALAQDYAQHPAAAFDTAPVQRLGAILTSASSDMREDMLDGLGLEDPVFARDVRRAIFTFKDIAQRVRPGDISTCLRAVDPGQLTLAMAAALRGPPDIAATAEFILSHIAQRLATQLREEAGERGEISAAEGEAAMAAVTHAVRDLADQGRIMLRAPDAAD